MAENRSSGLIPRNALPYLVIITVLIIVAVVTWVTVVNRTNDPVSVACERTDLGTPVASTQLIGVSAAAPESVPIRVLNANGRSGQASTVGEQLVGHGFSEHPEGLAGNDEATPEQDLDCYGQIRYGATNIAQAAALHLALPCMELITDNRTDGTVDIALGTGFNGLEDSSAVQSVYEALNNGDTVEPELLEQASQSTC